MKLTKTLALTALVAGGLFAATPALQAQDAPKTPPPGAQTGPGQRGRPDFAKELNLTEDQKPKAKPIFDEMQQKMTALRQDTALSQEDRTAKRKEIRDAATAKLKEVPLTQEQLDKWTKMGQRRPPGAGGPPPAGGDKPAK
jgi:protein CpxP